VTHIDGKPVVPEDVQDLYVADIDRLAEEAMGGDFLSSKSATSPSSSKEASPIRK
jgi:hypothetical protein